MFTPLCRLRTWSATSYADWAMSLCIIHSKNSFAFYENQCSVIHTLQIFCHLFLPPFKFIQASVSPLFMFFLRAGILSSCYRLRWWWSLHKETAACPLPPKHRFKFTCLGWQWSTVPQVMPIYRPSWQAVRTVHTDHLGAWLKHRSWGEAWDSIFLKSSQEMCTPLVYSLYSE